MNHLLLCRGNQCAALRMIVSLNELSLRTDLSPMLAVGIQEYERGWFLDLKAKTYWMPKKNLAVFGII